MERVVSVQWKRVKKKKKKRVRVREEESALASVWSCWG